MSYVNVGFLFCSLSKKWHLLRTELSLEERHYREIIRDLEIVPKAMEYAHTERIKRTETEIETINKIYEDLYELWKRRRLR